jgi:hypothetical protein
MYSSIVAIRPAPTKIWANPRQTPKSLWNSSIASGPCHIMEEFREIPGHFPTNFQLLDLILTNLLRSNLPAPTSQRLTVYR